MVEEKGRAGRDCSTRGVWLPTWASLEIMVSLASVSDLKLVPFCANPTRNSVCIARSALKTSSLHEPAVSRDACKPRKLHRNSNGLKLMSMASLLRISLCQPPADP